MNKSDNSTILPLSFGEVYICAGGVLPDLLCAPCNFAGRAVGDAVIRYSCKAEEIRSEDGDLSLLSGGVGIFSAKLTLPQISPRILSLLSPMKDSSVKDSSEEDSSENLPSGKSEIVSLLIKCAYGEGLSLDFYICPGIITNAEFLLGESGTVTLTVTGSGAFYNENGRRR